MNQKQLYGYAWSKPTISFYSLKNKRRIWCESYLERDALLRLEFRHDVTAYRAQPLSLLYSDREQKQRRYTPDQLILESGKLAFKEVKRDEAASRADFRESFSEIRTHITGRYQVPLELTLESEIRQGALVQNLRMLYGYKAVSLTSISDTKHRQELGSECTLGEIREYVAHRGLSPAIPFALVAQDHYCCDLIQPLNDETILRVA